MEAGNKGLRTGNRGPMQYRRVYCIALSMDVQVENGALHKQGRQEERTDAPASFFAKVQKRTCIAPGSVL